MDDYGELFRDVRIEKAIMFALLALIVAIASLNIVSGQAMLVNDKRGDVAMLATMGASRGLLVGVFFLQGFSVAFLGVATGLLAGIAVAVNANDVVALFEGLVGASLIEGTYFERIHSRLEISDLLAIGGVSLGLSLAAVLRPAFKAAAENPADALHAA
ncbi:MAG: FtsX-like permease family protein [Gammaproteobacteria bacterium]|nr:FtsX-like permease family protein [Gammaproteobacteria bacterium]